MAKSTEKNPELQERAEEDQLRVAKQIKTMRLAANLTQDALARRANLSRTSLTNIEAGRQTITMFQLSCIANALGIPTKKLL
jgi:transcriptional regulator with XRE-family HTH domain